MKELFSKYKPGVPKRVLLLVAGMVWTVASGMLLYRGIYGLERTGVTWLELLVAIVAGILFFFFLFMRISFRHINRIRTLQVLRPCVFSFFDFRSYAIMAVMITMGVLLRKSGVLNPEFMSLFYITMGIPLGISAIRFYFAWMKYHEITA